MTSPYISIVFASRNDEYTKDQSKRIRTFIDFYSYYDKKYPELFEFLICDWNSPEDRPLLQEAYPWDAFSRVRHFVVSREIHEKMCPTKSRQILDYWAKNVCIRRSKAPFILLLTEDVFYHVRFSIILLKKHYLKNISIGQIGVILK